MSRIFISHSSVDKNFVRRLALDLLDKDFDVWFDEWRLEVGQKLTDTIKQAVDQYSYFLLVLSENIADSKWVEQEIRWALEREQLTGRLVLLPIKIDDCTVPDNIADRLYADFSVSYVDPLEQLVDQLRDAGLGSDGDEAPRRHLIPVFAKGIDLDGPRLERWIGRFKSRVDDGYMILPGELRYPRDDSYESLRGRMFKRLENIESDPYYTPDFASGYRTYAESLRNREKAIGRRLAGLLTHRGLHRSSNGRVGTIAAEYWKLARADLIGMLHNAQSPDDPEVTGYGKEWFTTSLVAKLHGIDRVTRIDVFPWKKDRSYSADIDSNSDAAALLKQSQNAWPLKLSEEDPELLSKWILPQIMHYDEDFDAWNLIDGWYCGLH